MTPEEINKKEQRPVLRKWLQMGVELEGAWDGDPAELASKVDGAKAKRDGSVSVGKGTNSEITTRPRSRLDDIISDLRVLWPHYCNDTCGFHIHTSFMPLDASSLTDKDFWTYFRRRWEAWGVKNEKRVPEEFWDRFYARTVKAKQYCKAEFKPIEQLSLHQDRYTALNFVSWSKFKTVECRFLPMFKDMELGFDALRELSDIYDTYLNMVPFPKISLERQILVNDKGVIEQYDYKYPRRDPLIESRELQGAKIVQGKDVYYRTKAMDLMFPWARETELPEGLIEEDE